MIGKMLFALVLVSSATTFASDTSHADKASKPAHRYSGSAPVDLGRGLPFNNGTYGTSNPGYEELANSGHTAPGLRASPYAFDQRGDFVAKLKDLFQIYEQAIDNLEHNKDQRAEVKAYREKQKADLETRLAAAKDAAKKAGSSNEGEWMTAQEEARRAFSDLQALLVRNNTKY